MKRDYNAYLFHILDAIDTIESYAKSMTEEEFYKAKLIQDGVIRNLEIIGEAAKNIPESVKKEYPRIEWKKISGMRNVLIHEYFGVDIERVWKVIKNRLPDLRKKIQKITKDLSLSKK